MTDKITDKITCVLIDDERSSLNLLIHYVKNHPALELLEYFTQSIEAMHWLQGNEVDLLITDIDMADLDGINLVHSLVRKPLVILCTGHESFALRGYEVSPVDFLLKPVRHEFFLNAIEKTAVRLSKSWAMEEKSTQAFNFVVEMDTGYMVRVDLDDIKYIESKENYVSIHCLNHSVTTRRTLNSLLEFLPAESFMRVHRSFVIALPLLHKLKEGKVLLTDVKEEIPLGSQYARQLRDYVAKRGWKF